MSLWLVEGSLGALLLGSRLLLSSRCLRRRSCDDSTASSKSSLDESMSHDTAGTIRPRILALPERLAFASARAAAAHPLYHAWIEEQRLKVLPQRKLREDSISCDIQCSPQDYLPRMIYMMKSVEARGGSVNNTCPLRTNMIPKHFHLDTVSLVNICFTSDQGNKVDYTTKGNYKLSCPTT